MRTKNKWITALGATALCAVAVQLQPQEVTAADHADAPMTMADGAADIADFYAWHTERGTIVAVMTFAALRAPGDEAVYDTTKLYTINIDNTYDPALGNPLLNDNEPDVQIQLRFGQNNIGEWGVQVNNLPGADDATFDGPVQTVLSNGTASAIAGDFDDPFFFDFEGFLATRDNLLDDADPADVAFTSADFFAGTNAMAVVVEFDAAMAADGNNFVQLWATTGVTP